ncbi:MAG: hypothetical protein H0V24_05635 [Chloroflexia bacterium]|nr:hypothetical protein [Chloroflexia bacterium]
MAAGETNNCHRAGTLFDIDLLDDLVVDDGQRVSWRCLSNGFRGGSTGATGTGGEHGAVREWHRAGNLGRSPER